MDDNAEDSVTPSSSSTCNEGSAGGQEDGLCNDFEGASPTTAVPPSSHSVPAMPSSSFERLSRLLTKTSLYSSFISEQLRAEEDSEGSGRCGATPVNPSDVGPERKRGRTAGTCMQQPLFLTKPLFPHQLEALRWLCSLYKNGVNGILADEMGLGKTIEVIAFFAELLSHGVFGPHIVVAPLSTIDNWYREFREWCPIMPVIIYHGSHDERIRIRRIIRRRSVPIPAQMKRQYRGHPEMIVRRYGGVIITNYDMINRDARHLRCEGRYRWNCLVVDEAHRLKNFECKLIRILRRFPVAARLLLTGTPLQNNLSELWSVLNFIVPEVFNELEEFQRWFEFDCGDGDGPLRALDGDAPQQPLPGVTCGLDGETREGTETAPQVNGTGGALTPIPPDQTPEHRRSQTALMIAKMHRVLRPFLLRRVKDEIPVLNLPEKYEIVLRCRLAQLQSYAYNMVGSADHYGNGRLFHLQKVCDHPHLFSEFDPFHAQLSSDSAAFFCDPRKRQQYRQALLRDSAKLAVLHRMLVKLKPQNCRVLLFSHLTSMLDIIEDLARMSEWTYQRLDGGCSRSARGEILQTFSKGETFLFLISTRAGGLGVNLCAADTVILFDSDFNPHNDIQAIDRCHRIGQTKPVVVYRLVCSRTIEEVVVNVSLRKLRMEKLVIGAGRFNRCPDAASVEESAAKYEAEQQEVERALKELVVYRTATVEHDLDESAPGGLREETLELLTDRSRVIQYCEEKRRQLHIGEIETAFATSPPPRSGEDVFEVV